MPPPGQGLWRREDKPAGFARDQEGYIEPVEFQRQRFKFIGGEGRYGYPDGLGRRTHTSGGRKQLGLPVGRDCRLAAWRDQDREQTGA